MLLELGGKLRLGHNSVVLVKYIVCGCSNSLHILETVP